MIAERTQAQKVLTPSTGIVQLYQHSVSSDIRYSAAVKTFVEQYKAFWLLDEILFFQSFSEISNEPVQVWKFHVYPSGSGCLRCEDEKGDVLLTKVIFSIGFSLPGMTLFLKEKVIQLPEEV